MKSDKQLAENLTRLRQAAGLTREALARAVGIEAQTLYQYERCLRWPKGENLDALAKALNVRPWQLLAGKGEAEVIPAVLVEHVAASARACGLKVSK